MKLTAATVKNIKASDARQEIPDAMMPGLYLVVQPTGKKSWKVRYRFGGKQPRMTLGKYPDMSLADARDRARDVFREVQSGFDPQAQVRTAKTEAPTNSVSDALDDYYKRKLAALKSGDQAKAMLERFIRPALGERVLTDIAREDVQSVIDDINTSGRGVTANRCLAYTKAFLNWCCDRGKLEVSPADRIKKAVKEKQRDRLFDEDEIRWFWQACDKVGYPWGDIGKLLLLTGQRRNEIAHMADNELRGESLALPSGRTKNGRAHAVPLSEMAFDIIEALPRIENPRGYLFTTNGRSPVSGFTKGQQRIAKEMEKLAEREIPHWTWHDLRHCCATGLAFYARIEVVEKALNHVSGKHGGIAGRYNHHEYSIEMREALEHWAENIRRITGNNEDE
ncbi:tyrosine-type recombinase/integrase [Salipiger mangrovisoli]|uniref:Site-specific integrase n=1 Tax=Salipiger mangrovisoli TaxID=2865933 RepID=A0ABR9WZ15_9RHOB|nr:site-specific integrase [Salipiger mangrovisoli]MBE9636539.1 site-specific integrase [Salipiger mangrovisoli]